MKYISKDKETYAILVDAIDIQEGTEWFGSEYESLQASRMNYPKGKIFRTHQHILNPRTIKRTQEAFVVISGAIRVDVYDTFGKFLDFLIAEPGEAVLLYRGGHGIKVLADCVAYEIKAGQFSVVSEDKEFI